MKRGVEGMCMLREGNGRGSAKLRGRARCKEDREWEVGRGRNTWRLGSQGALCLGYIPCRNV